MANCVKKYKFLTLEEGVQIFEHREKNPKDSFETIAKIFSEKLGKKLNRITVQSQIKVALPVPPTDQQMTKKKKQQSITGFFSKQKANKEC